MLDLGTGLRFWGETLDPSVPFVGSALVTHIHWDHVQGLPFFTPILRPGAHLDVYGPPQEYHGTLAAAFDEFLRPPFFPITATDLPGEIRFHDAWDSELELDGAKVKVRPVPHVGLTNGYRVEMGGGTVAYLSDHQMPFDGSHKITDGVLDLCDGADLLIHDAQYSQTEFAMKSTWGHCTVDFAVHVAAEAGVRTLALFHHDPARDDAQMDDFLDYARHLSEGTGVEVIGASEGLSISLGS